MKNKIFILFFLFITSCQNLPTYESAQIYEKIGFAEISNDNQIAHHTIAPNRQIRITNLLNKKNIIVNVDKNLNYKKQREIILPNKYSDLLELNYGTIGEEKEPSSTPSGDTGGAPMPSPEETAKGDELAADLAAAEEIPAEAPEAPAPEETPAA